MLIIITAVNYEGCRFFYSNGVIYNGKYVTPFSTL